MNSRLVRPLLVITCLLLAIWLGYQAVRSHQGLAEARASAKEQQWARARVAARRYLWLHPGDDQARLLLAEALVRDDLLERDLAAAEALQELDRIGSDSRLSAQARTQAGRLQLLVQHHPAAAEEQFRTAIVQEPDLLDAHYMLWKLLDLTGRAQQAEPSVWRVYRLSEPEQRPARLREWYMSQFFPAAANPGLERSMGLLGPTEQPGAQTELRRLATFQQLHPEAALGHAAVANWLRVEGDPKEAKKVLDEGLAKAEAPLADAFFVSTLVATLLDLGEFEQAEQVFEQWPQPREGFEYWKSQAFVLDEVKQEYEQAIVAYDKCLAVWPGPVEWRTRNRKANCLAQVGRVREAARQREHAKRIEKLMESSVHARLRLSLAQLESPTELAHLEEFYRLLGRAPEADAWAEQIQRLERSSRIRQKP